MGVTKLTRDLHRCFYRVCFRGGDLCYFNKMLLSSIINLSHCICNTKQQLHHSVQSLLSDLSHIIHLEPRIVFKGRYNLLFNHLLILLVAARYRLLFPLTILKMQGIVL